MVFKKNFQKFGSLRKEETLFKELGEKDRNSIYFLLSLGDSFERVRENDDFHALWTADRQSLEKAKSDDACKCVLLSAVGDRAFCAGGDIKAMAKWVSKGDFISADRFFKEEYALDLFIHQFPKPLLVLIDGCFCPLFPLANSSKLLHLANIGLIY